LSMPEPFQPLRTSVARAARRLGAGVILTGQGGDLMTGNWFDDSLQVAAPLRLLQLRRAFEDSLAWSRILRLPIYRVLSRGLQAALPPALASPALYSTGDASYVPKNEETSIVFKSGAGRSRRDSGLELEGLFSDEWLKAPPERRKYFKALSAMFELRLLQPG